MLIYVDKKKERRRKIKIFCIISFILIFISLNILYYHNYIHHGKSKLFNYQRVEYQNDWYNKTSPIYTFTNKSNPAFSIIILPQTLNRETAQTFASALVNFPPQNYSLTFTSDIKNKNFLKQIAEIMLPKTSKDDHFAEIVITDDFSKVKEQINYTKLYPKTYNYAKAKQFTNEALNNLLDAKYPPLPQPQTKIEKEQYALATFLKENKEELLNLIHKNISPKYSKQSTFLKTVRLCLQSHNIVICQMQPDTSLILNIRNAVKNFPKENQPQKLLLLSSNEEINQTNLQNLKADEGLYFRFNQREAYLLPHEISTLTIEKEPIYILKEKAGFNPEYTSPQMELYKFNITEVNLDEEI